MLLSEDWILKLHLAIRTICAASTFSSLISIRATEDAAMDTSYNIIRKFRGWFWISKIWPWVILAIFTYIVDYAVNNIFSCLWLIK